jgi:hypothetical protein
MEKTQSLEDKVQANDGKYVFQLHQYKKSKYNDEFKEFSHYENGMRVNLVPID